MNGWRGVIAAASLLTLVALASGLAHAQSSSPRRWLQDGLFSAAQAERGKVAYDINCAQCHMADLGGHEYAGPLAGEGFRLKWQDASLADFLGRIRSMPLGRPGLLERQQYLDILAYALQKNGYPSGGDELTMAIISAWPQVRIERLHRFQAKRPQALNYAAGTRASIAAAGRTPATRVTSRPF